MTEQLHFHFSLSCIGEGSSNPLQCSCLENPRDGGAWWAAVYGAAQSRTRLKRLSSSSSSSSRTDSSVHGSLQARTLEWVACPPPGDLPDPGIQPVSFGSCTAGEFFTVLPLGKCRKWQNENFNPHQLVSKANAELKGSFKAN